MVISTACHAATSPCACATEATTIARQALAIQRIVIGATASSKANTADQYSYIIASGATVAAIHAFQTIRYTRSADHIGACGLVVP